MAISSEWTIWHLTPTGWRQGDGQLDSGPVSNGPVPIDRVLSFRYREVVRRPYSGIDESLKEIWRGPDELLIERFLTLHGPCPAQI
jgi:hypothetical protein